MIPDDTDIAAVLKGLIAEDPWGKYPHVTPFKDEIDHSKWMSLAKSNAGYEMLRYIAESNVGDRRVIVSKGGVIVFGPSTDPGHVQQAWDKIHLMVAPPKPPQKKTNLSMVEDLGTHIKDFYTTVRCPVCTVSDSLFNAIQHINDGHRWEREKIADWLDTLDLDLTVHVDPVEPNQKVSPVIPDAMPFLDVMKFESPIVLAEVFDEIADDGVVKLLDQLAEASKAVMTAFSAFSATLTSVTESHQFKTFLATVEENTKKEQS